MGKSRKPRKNFRTNPINGNSTNGDVEISEEFVPQVTSSILDTIAAQLQSVNPEDKICACHSIRNLFMQEEARIMIMEMKFSRMCAPLLVEEDPEVVGAALGCLYNLSSQGEETVSHLVAQDVMTPLLSLISKFGDIVNIQDKQKQNRREQIISDSFNLLWNLVQEEEKALDILNQSNIITSILPFITNIVSSPVRVSALSLLVTCCDNNKVAQELVTPHLDIQMVSSEQDQLIRVTAALLLVTSHPDKVQIINSQHLSTILQCISEVLQHDVVNLLNDCKGSLDKQKSEHMNQILKAQITALEIVTNLCSSDEVFDDESEGDEDVEDVDSEEMDDGNDVDIGSDLKQFIDQIVSINLVQKLFEKTTDVSNEVKDVLLASESGKQIILLLEKLLIDSYLCLSNITELMNISQLGGGENVKNIWLQLCTKLCNKPENLELADGISGAVRSLTGHATKEGSGISLDNIGTNELEQLVTVYNNYSAEESSDTRTNIVNILGKFACVAVRNIREQACQDVISKMSSWILDVVIMDGCLRVAVEGIDQFMDVFGADETDTLYANLKLSAKLKHLVPSLKSRISKEKKKLPAEDIAVANTVKLNLQRFISYKDNRLKV